MSGNLMLDDKSATAWTYCHATGGTRTATAKVYYWFGSKYYMTKDQETYTSPEAACAIATIKKGGATVKAGDDICKAVYSTCVWKDTTTTGTIPSSYTVL